MKKIIQRKLYNRLRDLFYKLITKEKKEEDINEKFMKVLKTELKKEVEDLNKTLHKHNLINKKRNLVNEWGYEK